MEALTLLAAIMSIVASGLTVAVAIHQLRAGRKPPRRGRGRHRK